MTYSTNDALAHDAHFARGGPYARETWTRPFARRLDSRGKDADRCYSAAQCLAAPGLFARGDWLFDGDVGYAGRPGWGVPVGIVCLVVGTPLSIVLKVGTTNAKKNVERMLEAAGVDVEELMRRKKDEQ